MKFKRLIGRGLLALLVLVVVANWTWGRLPDEPPMPGKLLQVNGVSLHVVDRPAVTGGGATGNLGARRDDTGKWPKGSKVYSATTTAVFLHGLPGTTKNWRNVIDALPSNIRAVAIDRPGFGYSQGGSLSLTQQADAIYGALQKMGIARAVIVGHSYGGLLGLSIVERHPDAAIGLVTVGGAIPWGRVGSSRILQARIVRATNAPVVRPVFNAIVGNLFKKASALSGAKEAFEPVEVPDDYEQDLLATSMRTEDLQALAHDRFDFDKSARDLQQPTKMLELSLQVIHGRHDTAVSFADGERLASEVRGAKLIAVDGGHMLPYTHPQVIVKAITDQIKQSDPIIVIPRGGSKAR